MTYAHTYTTIHFYCLPLTYFFHVQVQVDKSIGEMNVYFSLYSIIMYHHLQEESSAGTSSHLHQALHLHHGPEQYWVCAGRLHGRSWDAGRARPALWPEQFHREHWQHESADGSHRGGQRSDPRPCQSTRQPQHHHHQHYPSLSSAHARARPHTHTSPGRHPQGCAQEEQVPFYWHPGEWDSVLFSLFIYLFNAAEMFLLDIITRFSRNIHYNVFIGGLYTTYIYS